MEHTLFTNSTWALYKPLSIPAKKDFKMNLGSTQASLAKDKIGPPLRLLRPSYSDIKDVMFPVCEGTETNTS